MIVQKKDIFIEYIPEGECEMERDTSNNMKLLELKKKDNSWSKEIIRFNWVRLKK